MDNKRQHERSDNQEIDPIDQHLQTIADLHRHAEHRVSPQQRAIEKVTDFLGQPRFLFIILGVAVLWAVFNTLLATIGLSSFDPPPFPWLQGLLTLGALLQATMI